MATFNRASFIRETLESIVKQMLPSIELVIVDGASKDDTETVIRCFIRNNPDVHIRYYREEKNSGVDADYDKAVGYATGQYCWLMTDDDLLLDGAVARILEALHAKPDLVVVNAEIRDVECTRVLDRSMSKLNMDRRYAVSDRDLLLAETGHCLSFIGSVVIDRALWMGRARQPFYGTAFIHVGVIFQMPAIGSVLAIATPLIAIRYGNAMWTARGFEIWNFKWPDLIWGTEGVSDAAKSRVCAREPWRNAKQLVLARALGSYSVAQYAEYLRARTGGLRRLAAFLISIVPAGLVNALVSLYLLVLRNDARMTIYDLSRAQSSTFVARWAARATGIAS
jgi:abequosyltransferase